MTKVFEQADLLAILAKHLGVDPSKCRLVAYCPVRGAHGACYGVGVEVSK